MVVLTAAGLELEAWGVRPWQYRAQRRLESGLHSDPLPTAIQDIWIETRYAFWTRHQNHPTNTFFKKNNWKVSYPECVPGTDYWEGASEKEGVFRSSRECERDARVGIPNLASARSHSPNARKTPSHSHLPSPRLMPRLQSRPSPPAAKSLGPGRASARLALAYGMARTRTKL